jgi:LacI family transcriptional regulator
VLLATWYYDREHHVGVARYAAEAGWVLQDTQAQTRGFDPNWAGDGVISFHGPAESFIRFLMARTVPVVDIGEYGHLSPFPRVRTDAAAIARMAATYFAGRGFKDVGFVEGDGSQARRRDAMRAEAARLGLRFTPVTLAQLRAGDAKLPRPIGLLAATDGVAIHAMTVLEDLGLRVPEQVALIGVDNDLVRCLPALVTLTSIDPDMQRVGYEAAALLDRLMDGQAPPAEPIDVEPRELVEGGAPPPTRWRPTTWRWRRRCGSSIPASPTRSRWPTSATRRACRCGRCRCGSARRWAGRSWTC